MSAARRARVADGDARLVLAAITTIRAPMRKARWYGVAPSLQTIEAIRHMWEGAARDTALPERSFVADRWHPMLEHAPSIEEESASTRIRRCRALDRSCVFERISPRYARRYATRLA
ncbi:Hypothetical protein A7982_00690 [Minicystis rosea]|nr:Hypothetical protein A7982_00690 [Minicystis rosea]